MSLHEETKQFFVLVEFEGCYNIGAFFCATNKFVLVPPTLEQKYVTQIERVMRVPVYRVEVMESPLLGLYVLANSNGVVLPADAPDEDVQALKRLLGVPVERVEFETHENALANIVLVNDRGGVIHEKFVSHNRKALDVIEDVLDVEIVPHNFAFDVIASACVANNRGVLCHPQLTDDDIEALKEGLKVSRCLRGTVNMGLGFVGTGLVANDYGLIAGLRTTGLELSRAYEVLLKED